MKSPHVRIEAEIEDVRLRAVLIFKDRYSFGGNYLGDRIVGIAQIGNPAGTERAILDTCRLSAVADPVIAEVAFVSYAVLRVEEPDTVRASHDAIATADAPFSVDQYNAIIRLVGSAYRANLHTGRVIALIAELGNEKSLCDIVGINLFIPNHVAYKPVAAAQR